MKNIIDMEIAEGFEAYAAFGSLALSIIANVDGEQEVEKLVRQYAEFEYDLMTATGATNPKSREDVIEGTIKTAHAFIARCCEQMYERFGRDGH